jgi:hypothetical protein
VALSPPPRDPNDGEVIPHDHDEIANEDDIIRRISDQQIVNVGGVRRISSLAFQASSDSPRAGMSIDIKSSIEAAGLNAATFVTTPKWTGSVVFKAGAARALGFMVGYDPMPDNDHHGEVWGAFTKRTSKSLQRACQWFVPVSGAQVF